MNLGHTLFGYGPKRVVLLHDWLSDSTSYAQTLNYLDPSLATYALVDLRGYGKSQNIPGECSLGEACADIIRLANHLKWPHFSLVGHSMSGLIALGVAAQLGERISKLILIAPVAPTGMPIPEEALASLEKGAQADDILAQTIPAFLTSMRYNQGFAEYKVRRWRETSQPQARVAYLHMFTQTVMDDAVKGLTTPTLLVTGDFDAQAHKAETLMPIFKSLLPHLNTLPLPCGHYPMEEVPPLFAKTLEDNL